MLNISLILVNKINNNIWKGNMAFLTSNFYQMQKIKKGILAIWSFSFLGNMKNTETRNMGIVFCR